MRALVVSVLVMLGGCGQATQSPPPAVAVPLASPAPPPAPPASSPGPAVTAQMIAATLGDDCGGAPPSSPPPAKSSQGKSERKADEPDPASKAKRRCDQSSIQLSIVAPAGASPATIRVKQVEVFDDAGVTLGVVQATSPRRWADAGYVDWDQTIDPGSELSVSYALSEPDWSKVEQRFNKTYVVKAVLSIGGADQPVETTVKVDAHVSPVVIMKT